MSAANSALGATLTAEYEAVRNDLVQAQELAAAYQRQLAEKSNDLADLKSLLERTQRDLQLLQDTIHELRTERHRLANEALRVTALEVELKYALMEKQAAQKDLESSRTALQCAHRSLLTLHEQLQQEQPQKPVATNTAEVKPAQKAPARPAPRPAPPKPEPNVIPLRFDLSSPDTGPDVSYS